MRSVSSAFWLALQQDHVRVAELIELTVPSGTLRWTTANHVIVSSGNSYLPFPGASGRGAQENIEMGVGTIEFSVVNSGELLGLIASNVLDQAPISVSRIITNSPDLGRMYAFRGKLADLSYTRNEISGTARNIFNGVGAQFPRYTYQDYCVWRFGSTGCGFNPSSVTVSVGLNPASGTPLTVVATGSTLSGSYSAGYLDRGRVTVLTGANSGQVRTVRAHTGDLLGLSHSLPYAVSSGDMISIYPGCRKRWTQDCSSKFNNTANALSFQWIPKQENAY